MIDRRQIRAGREMLGWTQEYLACRAGVSKLTLSQFERGVTSPKLRTLTLLENALKAAGVVCFDEDDRGGKGVRFR